MKYTSRGLRRRRDTDKWEVTLSSVDPLTGEKIRSFHTITEKTEKQALKARNDLILQLEKYGAAVASGITVRELAERLITLKEEKGQIEASTASCYRSDLKVLCRYLGNVRIADLDIPNIEDPVGYLVEIGARFLELVIDRIEPRAVDVDADDARGRACRHEADVGAFRHCGGFGCPGEFGAFFGH